MIDTIIKEGVDGIIALGTVPKLVQCIRLCKRLAGLGIGLTRAFACLD